MGGGRGTLNKTHGTRPPPTRSSGQIRVFGLGWRGLTGLQKLQAGLRQNIDQGCASGNPSASLANFRKLERGFRVSGLTQDSDPRKRSPHDLGWGNAGIIDDGNAGVFADCSTHVLAIPGARSFHMQ
eukprot:2848245-Pyramimonas_sp.AAC.1